MSLLSQYEKQLTEAQELADNGNLQQAVEIYTGVLRTIPEKTTDPALKKVRLQTLEKRGDALVRCHMPKTAIADFEQCRDEMGKDSMCVDILTKIARYYSMVGEQQTAMELSEEILALSRKSHMMPVQNARLYRVLGYVHMNKGNLDEAKRYYLKALDFLRSTDDNKYDQSAVLNDLGVVYKRQSIFDKSLDAYQESLVILQELERRQNVSVVLSNIGEVYRALFDFDTALGYHERALSTLTKADEAELPAFMCDLHRNMGLSCYGLGRFDEGSEHFKRAKTLNQIVRVPDVSMQILNSYAWAECMRGNVEFAQEMVEECLELSRLHQSKSHRVYAYYISGLCHEKLGDLTMANQEWQKAVYLAHETGQRMLLWRIHAALAESMTNADLAQVHYMIAADIIEQLVEPFTDEALRGKFLNAPPVQTVLSQVA